MHSADFDIRKQKIKGSKTEYILDRYLGASAEVTIPDGVTIIGDVAFRGHDEIVRLIMPDTVRNIFSGAFQDCVSLSDLTLSRNLTGVGNFAFENYPSSASTTD